MAGLNITVLIDGKPDTLRIQSDSGGGWAYGLARERADKKSGAMVPHVKDVRYAATLHGALLATRWLALHGSDVEGIDQLLDVLTRFDNEVGPLLTVRAAVNLED